MNTFVAEIIFDFESQFRFIRSCRPNCANCWFVWFLGIRRLCFWSPWFLQNGRQYGELWSTMSERHAKVVSEKIHHSDYNSEWALVSSSQLVHWWGVPKSQTPCFLMVFFFASMIIPTTVLNRKLEISTTGLMIVIWTKNRATFDRSVIKTVTIHLWYFCRSIFKYFHLGAPTRNGNSVQCDLMKGVISKGQNSINCIHLVSFMVIRLNGIGPVVSVIRRCTVRLTEILGVRFARAGSIE